MCDHVLWLVFLLASVQPCVHTVMDSPLTLHSLCLQVVRQHESGPAKHEVRVANMRAAFRLARGVSRSTAQHSTVTGLHHVHTCIPVGHSILLGAGGGPGGWADASVVEQRAQVPSLGRAAE